MFFLIISFSSSTSTSAGGAGGAGEVTAVSLIALGVFTLVPNLILKVDYGRWMFSIIVYYILIFAFLIAIKDKQVIPVLNREIDKIKAKPFVFIFYVLPLMVTPMWDVNISMVSAHLAGDLNNNLLHLWVD